MGASLLKEIKESLWSQFGASLDTLENVINLCPEMYWDTDRNFWHIVYHTLFFLDCYLCLEPEFFSTPDPFTHSEFEDGMPDRVYSKEELLSYLRRNRNTYRNFIEKLTLELLESRWINASGTMNYSIFEILLYNMRHVQHHAAQLNRVLREAIDDASPWFFRVKHI